MLFWQQSWQHAVGWGYGAGAIGVMAMLVQGFPAKFGFAIPGLVMELVIHVLAAVVLLVPKFGLSPRIVQVIACFGLANGIVGYINPVTFAGIWGLGEAESRRQSIQKGTRSVAAAIAASSITTLLLFQEERGTEDVATTLGVVVLVLGLAVNRCVY